jgi:RAB protein geranylgeranyltransferase component A
MTSPDDEFALPSECDVLILGTSLVESILSAACARRGARVVHLDARASYGGAFGAFRATTAREGLFASDAIDARSFHAPFGACVREETGEVDEEACRRLQSETSRAPTSPTRGYSIDLSAPKLVLGADAFCEALVLSGAHKYLEFKPVERTFVYDDGIARAVASNRNDVFKDKTLTGAEKRALMRFLKNAHNVAMRDETSRRRSGKSGEETNVAVGAPGSEWGGDAAGEDGAGDDGLDVREGETMDAFLMRQGLSAKLRAAVTYALALQTRADCSAVDALEDLKVYILSVAKYGPQTGACLIPVYGSGDIPQAFCRVGAVKGATYVLRQAVRDVDVNADEVTTVTSKGGQEIRVKHGVVMHEPTNEQSSHVLVHAACVLDGPLVPEYGQMLVVFPPGSVSETQTGVVRALQIGSHTGCCPDGKYLLYVSNVVARDSTDPYAGVKAALDVMTRRGAEDAPSVFGEEYAKPEILWGTMYVQNASTSEPATCASSNIALCPGADDLATYQGAVRAARRAYAKLYGDAEELFPAEEDTPENDGDEEIDAMLEQN